MTARIRRPANRTPPELLKRKLVAYVCERGECRAGALVSALHCSRGTVLKHAKDAEAAGLLHHISVNRAVGNGVEFLFRAGPAPVAALAPMNVVDPWMLPREFFQGAHA